LGGILRRMDPASLASALVGAQTGMLQLAAAARLAGIDADNGSSIVKLIDAAQQNANSLTSVATGIGGNLDITA
jgi:hypothetical protein